MTPEDPSNWKQATKPLPDPPKIQCSRCGNTDRTRITRDGYIWWTCEDCGHRWTAA